MIDGRKNYVSAHLDILIEMVTTVHHVQSLDLNKFYVSRDKELSRQEAYKWDLYACHNSKKADVDATI